MQFSQHSSNVCLYFPACNEKAYAVAERLSELTWTIFTKKNRLDLDDAFHRKVVAGWLDAEWPGSAATLAQSGASSTRPAGSSHQSTLAPERRTSAPHFSTSSFSSAANSAVPVG